MCDTGAIELNDTEYGCRILDTDLNIEFSLSLYIFCLGVLCDLVLFFFSVLWVYCHSHLLEKV